jgi:hypothetical protein
MLPLKLLTFAVLAVTAGGCTTDTEVRGVQLRRVDSQHVAVHRLNGAEAIVSAAGEISIDGKSLALSAAQKDLAITYFGQANAVRDDGFATGMAGASTAMTAISSVVSGLANGEPDKIGSEIDAKASKIQVHVDKLCRDLRELATTQNELAASLPEFKPFAMIGDRDVRSCHG